MVPWKSDASAQRKTIYVVLRLARDDNCRLQCSGCLALSQKICASCFCQWGASRFLQRISLNNLSVGAGSAVRLLPTFFQSPLALATAGCLNAHATITDPRSVWAEVRSRIADNGNKFFRTLDIFSLPFAPCMVGPEFRATRVLRVLENRPRY